VKFKEQVEQAYRISINKITPAPRGFCAETFYLDTGNEKYFITHGDMPGNLMIDEKDKIYIVDWDDILMAPIERDWWIYLDTKEHIKDIAYIFKMHGINWKFNRDYYNYYVYTRFFDDLYGYVELDIFHRENPLILAGKIKTEVYDWLIPLM